jgi:hypothetical protein
VRFARGNLNDDLDPMKVRGFQAALFATLAFGCGAGTDHDAGLMASISTSTSSGASLSTTSSGCDYEIYVDVGAVRLSDVDQWLGENGEIYPQTCLSACILIDVYYNIRTCRILRPDLGTGTTGAETETSSETTALDGFTATSGTTGTTSTGAADGHETSTDTDSADTSTTAGRAQTVLLECEWQYLCDWK